MAPKRLKSVDWSIEADVEDFRPTLRRFDSYLKGIGLRESTITDYVARVGRFLKYAQTDQPSIDIAHEYRDYLITKNLARSTINNCSFALEAVL
jgi:hypothetical protein